MYIESFGETDVCFHHFASYTKLKCTNLTRDHYVVVSVFGLVFFSFVLTSTTSPN